MVSIEALCVCVVGVGVAMYVSSCLYTATLYSTMCAPVCSIRIFRVGMCSCSFH